MASLADSVCVHGLVADTDATVEESAALAPAVDVTPRLERPASSVTGLTETSIVFEAPVADERRIKCAPSVPVTTVAVTPGLLDDELIALAMPLTVLFVDVMPTLIDLSPTETFIAPTKASARWQSA
jgi:hypothetical protein